MRLFMPICMALTMLASACSPAAQPAAPTKSGAAPTAAAAAGAAKTETIRLAVSQTDSNFYSPIFIALKEGFYKAEGIELDVKSVNPPTATQALIANQFDIAHGAAPAFAAALQGANVKLIYTLAERSPYWVIAKKDVKNWADLKGKKIGVSSTTGTQVVDASRLLKLHGINAEADGVQYVVPGGPGDADKYAALKSGTIDAGFFSGLGGVQAIFDGYPMIGDFAELKGLDYTLWTTDAFIQSKPQLVQGFVNATLKGVQIYKDNPERALRWGTEQFEGDQKSAEKLRELTASWYLQDGMMSDAALKEGLGYRREALAQPSSVTDAQIVNSDFVKKANEALKSSGFKP
ncbi:MAG TPA: ABC transporter substrate-binding protein [Chloroflexota bacterium]|jgi:NitT/TauT family transport system substrate-binding protein